MSNLIYLLQVATIFSVLYFLYLLFLKKLTFHSINRIVLLLLLPVSLIMPFSNNLFPVITSKVIEIPLFERINFVEISSQLLIVEEPLVTTSFNYSILLTSIYWLVFSISFIRILATARQLFVLKSKSDIQQKNGYKLVFADVPELFSCFNSIFVPKNEFAAYDEQVIEHEKAHIRLKHSWDVILTEIYITFFWFNPLLYFYRKSLKSVHEFQADKGVLKNGVKTSQYMKLLLQSLEVSKPNNLYNYFNQPILKKRVAMMTKPKSSNISKLKYIILLPVCVFLTSAFTAPIVDGNNDYLNILKISEFISIPPSLFPVQNATRKDITSYFGEKTKKRPSNVTHSGIDIRAKIGTPIFATADGVIAKASSEGDWGNLIVITHADGYATWYAHLNGFNVNGNQKVKKGDVIGYVGNTGLSTGPHLHYEVKQNGKQLNPIDYLE